MILKSFWKYLGANECTPRPKLICIKNQIIDQHLLICSIREILSRSRKSTHFWLYIFPFISIQFLKLPWSRSGVFVILHWEHFWSYSRHPLYYHQSFSLMYPFSHTRVFQVHWWTWDHELRGTSLQHQTSVQGLKRVCVRWFSFCSLSVSGSSLRK